MITLLVVSQIKVDDPDVIPPVLQLVAAFEALIEAVIVTVVVF